MIKFAYFMNEMVIKSQHDNIILFYFFTCNPHTVFQSLKLKARPAQCFEFDMPVLRFNFSCIKMIFCEFVVLIVSNDKMASEISN